ncbi:MAG: GAF domain-containing protein [Bacteroidales bacterium]|nr:GAF domain-containing protein [Bacteroidales bacterium]MBN2750207.1 GAF domain-containing protein [Bacteroidales bacterium]
MKIKMRIRTKLVLSVLFITAIAFAASVGYMALNLKNISLSKAREIANVQAKESANLVQSSLNGDLELTRGLTQSFQQFKQIPYQNREQNLIRAIQGVSINNPKYISVWINMEINAIDSTYQKDYGRRRYTYYRENGHVKYKYEELNLNGDDTNSAYYKFKVEKKDVLIDPYWFSYTENSKPILETSIAVPLIINNRFAGLFGLDVELTRYQELINDIKPFEGSFSVLLSNNSTIVAHPEDSLRGKLFSDIFSALDKSHSISASIYQGETTSFSFTDSVTNKAYYAIFQPIPIGSTESPWSFGVFVPIEVLVSEAEDIAYKSYLISGISLLVLIIFIWIFAYSITNPLTKTSRIIRELARGKIDETLKITVKTGDEIEEISANVNILIDGLAKTAGFAREIGKGNLNASYNKLSDDDSLGQALLEMRKSLEQAKQQEEFRRKEDDKINWSTQGVAKFAELLRQNHDNMDEFASQIISNLVKYVNANIGALFLVNDENHREEIFELAATFAYDRKKHMHKTISKGEGLVGRCAQEGETIYLTDIPKNYIHINSGLGDESPSSLMIAPLKLNDKVYGVIELGSFEEFEPHTISFVEKIGESIAATISTVKINIRTVRLLEESRIKSEELASQEEEMRQNMEELQATQEEAARKSAEMESLFNALNASSYVIEYDVRGKVMSVNQPYLELTRQKAADVIGTMHSDGLMLTDTQKKEYLKFWEDLRNGIIKKETNKVDLGGKVYTFIETYSPIFNENREVTKVLKIAHNITDFIVDKK